MEILLFLLSYCVCYKFNLKIDNERAKKIFYGVLKETYFQLDEKEMEERFQEFWNTIYKKDKHVLIRSVIPFYNLVVTLQHYFLAFQLPLSIDSGIDSYKKEIVQMLNPVEKQEEKNMEEEKEPTYFVRLGHNGQFSIICFSIDENESFQICDVRGPIKKLDYQNQMLILNHALSDIYIGNVEGYGFSGNLPALLEMFGAILLDDDIGEDHRGKILLRTRNKD